MGRSNDDERYRRAVAAVASNCRGLPARDLIATTDPARLGSPHHAESEREPRLDDDGLGWNRVHRDGAIRHRINRAVAVARAVVPVVVMVVVPVVAAVRVGVPAAVRVAWA